MADVKPPGDDLKEYAEGWITERRHTDAPPFLKLSYIVIALGCLAYALVYMNGETTHADRGPLVQQFNQVTASATSDVFMWIVAAIAALFSVGLVVFAFRPFHED